MPIPSLKRDLAMAVGFILFAAGPPVWAGTILDANQNTVTVEEPAKIVTLGAATTEIVVALGLGDRIVASDAGSRGVPGAETKATLGYHRQVNAEGVLSTGPDLVLATESSGPPAAISQLRAAGVPLAVLTDQPKVEAAKGRIVSVGRLLGRTTEADALVSSIDARLAEARASRPPVPARVLFLYARGGGVGQMAGDETIANEMIQLAGGTNAFAGTKGYTALTPEAVLLAKPDALLLTEGGLAALGGEDALWSIPGLAQLDRTQLRLVVIEDGLLLGFGPRLGDAALELSNKLYGESAR